MRGLLVHAAPNRLYNDYSCIRAGDIVQQLTVSDRPHNPGDSVYRWKLLSREGDVYSVGTRLVDVVREYLDSFIDMNDFTTVVKECGVSTSCHHHHHHRTATKDVEKWQWDMISDIVDACKNQARLQEAIKQKFIKST